MVVVGNYSWLFIGRDKACLVPANKQKTTVKNVLISNNIANGISTE
jgi:hypothetical protein